jgi:hypothetical protein
MAIKKLKHITQICRELYELQGMSAVIEYVNQYMEKNPDHHNIEFRQCPHCETVTPYWYNECMVCGQVTTPMSAMDVSLGKTIYTVDELRYLMEGLDDHDQLTLVTCDEFGDEQDHYPMALDVIDNIRLTDGTIVREVQFVQRPNSEPDTRDKQRLVDALIDVLAEDMAKGDTTVLDGLLLTMPYDVLKYALPEDMWADFEKFKEEV